MKKQILTSLISAGMMLLCGCAEQSSPEHNTPTAESTSSEMTAVVTTEAAQKYNYVHGTDGYYNLAEELKHFKMRPQYSGTCWLYAAHASMSTAYEKKTGKELDFEISQMLASIYGDNKQEGIFVRKGTDKANIGGCQEYVTEKLSNECMNGITLDSSLIIDPADREAIKSTIKTRGGVAVGIDDCSSKKRFFGSYLTVNYVQVEAYDHDVTLIGWDDHFPKDYFEVPAAEDGAWIAYNSNESARYFYISYCSPLEQAISHTVSDEYSEVLSYDAGNELDTYIQTGDSTKVANVFHRKGMLAAVGTYNDFDSQDITIEIMSADLNNVLYTQEATLNYYGYHTVQLTNPVEAEDFAVVITYTKGAPVEGEDIEIDIGTYKTSIEKGQSFVFVDGKWKDMADSDIRTVLRTEKGQSSSLSENDILRNELTENEIEAILKPDFEPGNCCIKALLSDIK